MAAAAVDVVGDQRGPRRATARPSLRHPGPRVLADVPWGAGAEAIERLVALHARLVGASPEEAAAAIGAVASAMTHDLMQRAARAAERGRCHRELPLTSRDGLGAYVDGVADLAFSEPGEDGERWIVVDYKTDARPESHVAYRAQVQIDARVLARAAGRPVRGVLLAV